MKSKEWKLLAVLSQPKQPFDTAPDSLAYAKEDAQYHDNEPDIPHEAD